jgi:hypothetical protein
MDSLRRCNAVWQFQSMFRHPCHLEDSVGDADEDANANLLQGYYEAPTSYNDATGSRYGAIWGWGGSCNAVFFRVFWL